MNEAAYHRGTSVQSIAVNAVTYANDQGLLQFGAYTISATVPGISLSLPSALKLRTGILQCEVWNVGANAFDLRNFVGTVLATLAPGDWATVSLITNVASTGQWAVHNAAAGSASEPAPSLLAYFVGGTSAVNSNKCHEYNHVGDVWTTKSNSSHQQYRGSCAVFAGAAHFLGTGDSDKRRVQKYDPDTWTVGTSITRGTSSQNSERDGAATIAGKGYAFGGTGFNEGTLEYDGTTWVTKSNRGTNRGWSFNLCPFPAHDISNTTAYLMSGGNAIDTGHNYVDAYVVDTYTVKTERTLPVYSQEGSCHNSSAGDVFVLCGLSGVSMGNPVWSGRVTRYATAADVHSAGTAFPQACGALMGVSIGTTAYFCFGLDTSGSSGADILTTRAFDMAAQTYVTKSSAPTAKDLNTMNQGAAIPP